ncbi:phosphoribosyltransferase family protein [Spirabiliibacterium falconis]|uniref:phosphoribosyltransferase family protein n=1 Tax=Spirabiliibacterium falconis TaxID=572023 RepID=UPI001AAD5C14|nr:phosphoribosyltransferase family protein [Spirabiliibacterium falconis]MBE2894610.1 amidophosphoribosyltransferase [Spirabiliibacterium falconis]
MRKYYQLLANSLGARCVLCHGALRIAQFGLCSRCYRTLPRKPYCARCGLILPHHFAQCGQCLTVPPRWQHFVQITPYQPPLSGLIHHFKFTQGYALDRTLARLLLLAIQIQRRHYQTPLPDEIIPVPLHHIRHKYRGYNQAELLAHHLAHWLNLPVNTCAVQRVFRTPPQRGLKAYARHTNIRNVFQVSETLRGKHIALLDDVVTTGATVNELCRVLRRVGVARISIWCLCRSQVD